MEPTEEKGKMTIAERLGDKLKGKNSIHISLIPEKTREAFEKLAHDEFCDHFGFTLKWLMDDLISPDNKMLIAKINELEERVANLEQTLTGATQEDAGNKETKPTTIRTVDGKERRIGK